LLFCGFPAAAEPIANPPAAADLAGTVRDPEGVAVVNASVALVPSDRSPTLVTTTDRSGHFEFHDVLPGPYRLVAESPGFSEVSSEINLFAGQSNRADLRFTQLAAQNQTITVIASEPAAFTPDPSERMLIQEEALEANPGSPGAPISIPGLPIESASGGIKAPQYFAPGVAGDHGEPIAQYFQVGDFLFPNNLPANAHGNGYADPNSLIAAGIGAVQVDGGAFNVREGNHAVNLAAAYVPRDRLERFVSLTGDYRDLDMVSGWSPSNPATRGWVAFEAAYGNGYLNRLEHRKQFKVNAYRSFTRGHHSATLFGIGYYGFSDIPGLIPVDVPVAGDTIDARQSDRTHTSIFVATDAWKFTDRQQLEFSGFFRTYNLQLRSNFGDGLIQQSEFRTITGGNVTYVLEFRKKLSLLAGFDLRRDAPRDLDLKHTDTHGVFQPVTSNDLTLGFATPYVSLDGGLTRFFHYDVGVRQEEVLFRNVDKQNPGNYFDVQQGLTLPKATFSFLPSPATPLPQVSFSVGEAFHTNDPRIGSSGTSRGTILAAAHASARGAEEHLPDGRAHHFGPRDKRWRTGKNRSRHGPPARRRTLDQQIGHHLRTPLFLNRISTSFLCARQRLRTSWWPARTRSSTAHLGRRGTYKSASFSLARSRRIRICRSKVSWQQRRGQHLDCDPGAGVPRSGGPQLCRGAFRCRGELSDWRGIYRTNCGVPCSAQ